MTRKRRAPSGIVPRRFPASEAMASLALRQQCSAACQPERTASLAREGSSSSWCGYPSRGGGSPGNSTATERQPR